MESRENYGKVEHWAGGQIVWYSLDGKILTLYPIERGDEKTTQELDKLPE